MSSPEERSEIYDYYARTRSFRIPDLSGQTSFIEKIDRQISRDYKPGVRKGETEQQVVNPKTISNGPLEKTELLHILGGRPSLSESPLNFTEAKCGDGCRKACKDGCKSTAK